MKVFIEVYIDNQSVFIIVYLSCCLGGLTEEIRVEEILQLTIQNENKISSRSSRSSDSIDRHVENRGLSRRY